MFFLKKKGSLMMSELMQEVRLCYSLIPSTYEHGLALFEMDPTNWTVLELYHPNKDERVKLMGYKVELEKTYCPNIETDRIGRTHYRNRNPHLVWKDLQYFSESSKLFDWLVYYDLFDLCEEIPIWKKILDIKVKHSDYSYITDRDREKRKKITLAAEVLKLDYVYLDLSKRDNERLLARKAKYDKMLENDEKAEEQLRELEKKQDYDVLYRVSAAEKELAFLKKMQEMTISRRDEALSQIRDGATGAIEAEGRILQEKC